MRDRDRDRAVMRVSVCLSEQEDRKYRVRRLTTSAPETQAAESSRDAPLATAACSSERSGEGQPDFCTQKRKERSRAVRMRTPRHRDSLQHHEQHVQRHASVQLMSHAPQHSNKWDVLQI